MNGLVDKVSVTIFIVIDALIRVKSTVLRLDKINYSITSYIVRIEIFL